jgi:hypothetical protein
MKTFRAILAFLVGFPLAITPAIRFTRYTHHNPFEPASAHYIAAVAVIGVISSLLGGYVAAKIAPQTPHGSGDAIIFVLLAFICWSLWQSPGREHWSLFIAILLMAPSVYIGNRLAPR